MTTRNLTSEFIPAWYRLRAQDLFTAIIVEVHRDIFPRLVSENWEAGKGYRDKTPEQYNVPEFNPPNVRAWGYGKLLIPVESSGPEWIAWSAALPDLEAEFENNPRIHCDEVGLPFRYTLELLFRWLWNQAHDENTTSCQHPQLLTIQNIRLPSPGTTCYGGSLGATITPAGAKWLSQQNESSLEDVEDIMMHAWCHMKHGSGGSPRGSRNPFRARCRPTRWVNLSIPGNSCGLDPAYYDEGQILDGYNLDPHNTDATQQQLTLLAGLCRLHELMWKD